MKIARHACLACTLLVACGSSEESETTPAHDEPAPGSETTSTPPVSTQAEPVQQEEPPPPPPPPPPAPTQLATARGEADATAGEDEIVLMSDGALTVGAASGTVEVPAFNEAFREHIAVSTVVIDRRAHLNGIVVKLPTEGDEDPPNRVQVFVVDGTSLRRVLDVTPDEQGIEVEFPGNGTARYMEGGGAACARANGAARAPRDQITIRIDPAGAPQEPTRRRHGAPQVCAEVAACPFVYLMQSDGTLALQGEILRNLVGEDAYALQSLPLDGGSLRVRLAEEKREVTYLDEIYVEVDGVRVEPRACDDAQRPAYCDADHQPFVMREGDALDLAFEATGEARLFARGYYLPVR